MGSRNKNRQAHSEQTPTTPSGRRRSRSLGELLANVWRRAWGQPSPSSPAADVAGGEWQRWRAKQERLERDLSEVRGQLDELRTRVATFAPGARNPADDAHVDTPLERAPSVDGPPSLSFGERRRDEMAAGPELALGTGRDDAAEGRAREFLQECDERTFARGDALDWLAARGARGDVVAEVGQGPFDWTLLRVSTGDAAVLVPALRRPMGRAPLAAHFELQGYNGVDALEARQIVRLPFQRRTDGDWVTRERGLIHG